MAIKKLPKLEQKNRTYILTGKSTPISYVLQSRHSTYSPLLYFDGVKNRAMRYSRNQASIFEDAQDDNVILDPIIFEDGKLIVNKEDVNLQLFLHLHPKNGKAFIEFNPELNAQTEVENTIDVFKALETAMDMDISELEAVLRVKKKETGEDVSKMTVSEIKRDAFNFAKNEPDEFMALANDSDIQLRNLAVRATDTGLITLRDNNTNFYWKDSDKKLVSVPFGDNPYSALASYFKTDEGVDTMKALTEQLS